MSNEIREKDHEWVKAFHSNFDRLLALLEKLLEKRQPSAYGDELLTDKEVDETISAEIVANILLSIDLITKV